MWVSCIFIFYRFLSLFLSDSFLLCIPIYAWFAFFLLFYLFLFISLCIPIIPLSLFLSQLSSLKILSLYIFDLHIRFSSSLSFFLCLIIFLFSSMCISHNLAVPLFISLLFPPPPTSHFYLFLVFLFIVYLFSPSLSFSLSPLSLSPFSIFPFSFSLNLSPFSLSYWVMSCFVFVK